MIKQWDDEKPQEWQQKTWEDTKDLKNVECKLQTNSPPWSILGTLTHALNPKKSPLSNDPMVGLRWI